MCYLSKERMLCGGKPCERVHPGDILMIQSTPDNREESDEEKLARVPEEVWSKGDGDIGTVHSASTLEFSLKPNAVLPRQPQYPLRPEAKEGIRQTIEQLLESGVLEEVDYAETCREDTVYVLTILARGGYKVSKKKLPFALTQLFADEVADEVAKEAALRARQSTGELEPPVRPVQLNTIQWHIMGGDGRRFRCPTPCPFLTQDECKWCSAWPEEGHRHEATPLGCALCQRTGCPKCGNEHCEPRYPTALVFVETPGAKGEDDQADFRQLEDNKQNIPSMLWPLQGPVRGQREDGELTPIMGDIGTPDYLVSHIRPIQEVAPSWEVQLWVERGATQGPDGLWRNYERRTVVPIRFLDTLILDAHDPDHCAWGEVKSQILKDRDNGKAFVAKVWSKVAQKLRIKLRFGCVYHPQSQGIVERANDQQAREERLGKNVQEEGLPIQPGDFIYVKVFRRACLDPRAEGPYQVTQVTPRALKVLGSDLWYHINSCYRAQHPDDRGPEDNGEGLRDAAEGGHDVDGDRPRGEPDAGLVCSLPSLGQQVVWVSQARTVEWMRWIQFPPVPQNAPPRLLNGTGGGAVPTGRNDEPDHGVSKGRDKTHPAGIHPDPGGVSTTAGRRRSSRIRNAADRRGERANCHVNNHNNVPPSNDLKNGSHDSCTDDSIDTPLSCYLGDDSSYYPAGPYTVEYNCSDSGSDYE
ncbi:hypothetical protein ACEWY4_001294 [Coilia grayii]|uniref:Integrase catalytic domain-containing protein n=1 Tax=Coilia grayii TaxID=363190 RepID=A0ABD1KSZ3_9TELE